MKFNTREFIQHLTTRLENHHGFKNGEFVQGKRRFQVRQDSYQNEPTIYLLYMPQGTLVEHSEHYRQRVSVETNLDIVAQQIADKIANILRGK
ncbi:hypothetical protein [Avibacterium paragallinarum]|uniref:hypothetical protein n=1 Tax=Avibacterium paragallinarum TaxID=728 RepID=UPI00397C6767